MEVPTWLERSELLVGKDVLLRLQQSNILLVGLGGVGSYAGEFLVRAGIGKMTIIDGDAVDATNKNRQLHALNSTIGQSKASLMANRFYDINPDLQLTVIPQFMQPEDMRGLLEKGNFDFVLDCIDSVSPKISLLVLASQQQLNVISSMGAGGKKDPSLVRMVDISETKNCKLAWQIRKTLRYQGVTKGVIAVYSEELHDKAALKYTDGSNFKKSFYGTISYMPALFGLYMASEVIRRLGEF
jgi:tRNA A37 threonylcarbamoyladenosine dehydratase